MGRIRSFSAESALSSAACQNPIGKSANNVDPARLLSFLQILILSRPVIESMSGPVSNPLTNGPVSNPMTNGPVPLKVKTATGTRIVRGRAAQLKHRSWTNMTRDQAQRHIESNLPFLRNKMPTIDDHILTKDTIVKSMTKKMIDMIHNSIIRYLFNRHGHPLCRDPPTKLMPAFTVTTSGNKKISVMKRSDTQKEIDQNPTNCTGDIGHVAHKKALTQISTQKRKLEDTSPRRPRGFESELSPKSCKAKCGTDGDNAMWRDTPLSNTLDESEISIHLSNENSQDAGCKADISFVVIQTPRPARDAGECDAKGDLTPKAIRLPPQTANENSFQSTQPLVKINNKHNKSNISSSFRTSTPNDLVFDSSEEGRRQLKEFATKTDHSIMSKDLHLASNRSYDNIRENLNSLIGECEELISSPDNSNHRSSKNPTLATDTGIAWELGGLLKSSQEAGTSNNTKSDQVNVRQPETSDPTMEIETGTQKRKPDEKITSPASSNPIFSKRRCTESVIIDSPIVKGESSDYLSNPSLVKQAHITTRNSKHSGITQNANTINREDPTMTNNQTPTSNSKQTCSGKGTNRRQKHLLPAFLIPNMIRNVGDFVRDLNIQNPEVRNGFDLKTMRSNGRKYISPRTQHFANMFKSPLLALGRFWDFVEIGTQNRKGNRVQVRNVPFTKSIKELGNRKDINYVRIIDVKSNVKEQYRTCTLVTEFNTTPPASIIIAGIQYRTSAFNQEPKRCTNCQKFGHVRNQCRSDTPICTFCGDNHTSDKCYQDKQKGKYIKLKCANCCGEHAASHKKCKIYLAAKHSINNQIKSQPKPVTRKENTLQGTASNQGSQSRTAPWHNQPPIASTRDIPALMDIVFPEPAASLTPPTEWIHFNLKDMPQHKYNGKLGITLRLLFAIKQSHPEAAMAVDNVAFTIGGGQYRNIIR